MSAQIQQIPIQSSFPEQFLESAPFPSWLKTSDGYYVSANAATDKLIGRPVKGQSIDALFGGDQAAEIRSHNEAALRTGFDQHVQVVNGQAFIISRWPVVVHGRTLIGAVAIPAKVSLPA